VDNSVAVLFNVREIIQNPKGGPGLCPNYISALLQIRCKSFLNAI